MLTSDIAVLGAGPYGLAAGAHLGQIKGLDVQVFGEPMDFWHSHMPEGMFLRSPWPASQISAPGNALTIDVFRQATGTAVSKPIPLARFVEYGRWFQGQAVPQLDRRQITRIERDANMFRLTLNDGAQMKAKRVVIAGGIGPFACRPAQFEGLFPQFVTHSSDDRNVSRFRGKKVAVIGAGQSALESAALAHEAGAEVEVIMRNPNGIHWLGWRARIQRLGPIARILYSHHDIGPAGVSRIVAFPDIVKHLPRSVQNRFRKRSLRPAGSRWLQDRFAGIKVTTGRAVSSAKPLGDELEIKLDDGTLRRVNHVVVGTGYKVDVSRYPFLPSELSRDLSCSDGFPLLTTGLESSIKGLHFLGAPAAWTFGPLMYFVCGTEYAAGRLARFVASTVSRNGHR